MRAFEKGLVALTLVTAFAAAAPQASAHYEDTYFPLHVGNELHYVTDGGAGQPQSSTVYIDAMWTSPSTGNVWFRMRGYNGDWTWVHQTAYGRVYEWSNRLWYRLHVGAGTRWYMSVNESATTGVIPCSNGARLEMVGTEQVTVPAGTFTAKHIRFRTSCADAGTTDEWFVRGIGCVKRVEQSFAGPRTTSLVWATISGQTFGSPQVVTTSVSTDQPDYWENHMPGPGPRPTLGPEITITATIAPTSGQPTVLNFQDFNIWRITVQDANGSVVWSGPFIRAMAPPGGVNRDVPASGLDTEFPIQFPYGTAAGIYTVRAQLLQPNVPEVTTTFDYGWAY